MTLDDEALRAFLRFTLKKVGPADLRELVESLTAYFPGLQPATIHGTLNDLLVEGLIKLSPDFKYATPCAAPSWVSWPARLKTWAAPSSSSCCGFIAGRSRRATP